MIETTININIDLLKKIDDASLLLNISKSKVISLLLIKIAHDKKLQGKIFSTVKYQQKADKKSWHKLHVCFDSAVHEYGLDLRKLLKKSVSFIIASAIGEILNRLIKEIKKKGPDKYSKNYVLITGDVDNINSFTIFLGYPRSKYLKKHIPASKTEKK